MQKINLTLTKNVNGTKLTLEEALKEHEKLIYFSMGNLIGRARRVGLDEDDLYQIGVEGFLKVFQRFDHSLGFQFSTYAVKSIRGYMLTAINQSHVGPTFSIEMTKISDDIFFNEHSMKTPKEISELYQIPLKLAYEVLSISVASKTLDINYVHPDGSLLEELIGDSKSSDFSEVEALDLILSRLDAEERKLIELELNGYTQNEIAKMTGLSQASISRMKKRTRAKIKGSYERYDEYMFKEYISELMKDAKNDTIKGMRNSIQNTKIEFL